MTDQSKENPDGKLWLSMLDMPAVLRLTTGMPPRAFRLLLAIEAHCRDRWMCWPSNKTLAELAGCHAHQLGGHLKHLRSTGWIKNLQQNDDKRLARYIAMLRRLDPRLPVAPEGATWETAEAERVTGNQGTGVTGKPVTTGEGNLKSSIPLTGKPVTPPTGNQGTGVTGKPVTNNHTGETARISKNHAVESQNPPTPQRGETSWDAISSFEQPHIPRAEWEAYVRMRNETGRPMNVDSFKKIVGRLYYLSKDGWDTHKLLRWLAQEKMLSLSNQFLRGVGSAGRRV